MYLFKGGIMKKLTQLFPIITAIFILAMLMPSMASAQLTDGNFLIFPNDPDNTETHNTPVYKDGSPPTAVYVDYSETYVNNHNETFGVYGGILTFSNHSVGPIFDYQGEYHGWTELQEYSTAATFWLVWTATGGVPAQMHYEIWGID
jgi:hypothetical protein